MDSTCSYTQHNYCILHQHIIMFHVHVGHGSCDCDDNKCVCNATGPVSGRIYTGDLCECNPDFCFNENFPNVHTYIHCVCS